MNDPDLVDRKWLLNAMKQHGNNVQGESGEWHMMYSPGVRLCMRDAEEAPAAAPVHSMINVKEQPPREDCVVFDTETKELHFVYAEDLDFVDWHYTHWIPLPQRELQMDHYKKEDAR